MNRATLDKEILERELSVRRVTSMSFRDLVLAAGLDPARHLRYKDWSRTPFANQDLRGMDFTGARLVGCSFANAEIAQARFGQAVTGEFADGFASRSKLWMAGDWHTSALKWAPHKERASDGHLRDGDLFRDVPFSPDLVVFAAQNHAFSGVRGNAADDSSVLPISYSFAIALAPVTLGEAVWFRTRSGGTANKEVALRQASTETALMSWQEANEYVDWLTSITGKIYRILSESEWELAMKRGALEYDSSEPTWEFCEDNWLPHRTGVLDDGQPYKGDDHLMKVIRRMAPEGPLRHLREPIDVRDGKRFALRVARELDL